MRQADQQLHMNDGDQLTVPTRKYTRVFNSIITNSVVCQPFIIIDREARLKRPASGSCTRRTVCIVSIQCLILKVSVYVPYKDLLAGTTAQRADEKAEQKDVHSLRSVESNSRRVRVIHHLYGPTHSQSKTSWPRTMRSSLIDITLWRHECVQ
ncbi:uncharacterized protein LAESUDRAFT_282653 [Laetiporus sulphureus 93-53]|uniref:Uncharacterized protein n=1 Tax=Laetiporus sulphureus 93-53 TaxID=1314785 RepID=A0A165DF52_9APHY|nr:uncharacterized protein LAESUDRAFT_282653 [Laetiporus sulphureus 93-53]KZT04756.1 hypothetical protein LAESUDRAFT_282653 [Laetiporus sulphureus 93-53]